MNESNEDLFEQYSPAPRKRLLELRSLIFKVAKKIEGVGPIEETLRWGRPSYLTSASKSGTLIRIDQYKIDPEKYAIYFHCPTTLISSIKSIYGDALEYESSRAIIPKCEAPSA